MTNDERNAVLDEAAAEIVTNFNGILMFGGGPPTYVQMVGEVCSYCFSAVLALKKPPDGPGWGKLVSQEDMRKFAAKVKSKK